MTNYFIKFIVYYFLGDICRVDRTNENGVCKLLSQCPKAVADLKTRIFPTTCGFKGTDIIVCCVQAEETSNREKSNKQPGEISDESKYLCN